MIKQEQEEEKAERQRQRMMAIREGRLNKQKQLFTVEDQQAAQKKEIREERRKKVFQGWSIHQGVTSEAAFRDREIDLESQV